MDGLEVELEHGLSQFEDEVAVIFLPPSSVNTVGRAKRLEKWVRDGGHLVVMLDGGELGGNDFRPSPNPVSVFNEKIERPGVDYLLKTMGLELESWSFDEGEDEDKVGEDSEKSEEKSDEMDLDEWEILLEKDRVLIRAKESQIKFGGKSYSISHWSNQAVVDEDVSADGKFASEAEGEKHRFLSAPLGEGRVTWLTDAHPLRNRFIAEADHAKFLKGLVELSRSGRIVFSKGEGDGLFSLLWRHFPLAVIALLIVVVVWLWRNLPRFGPPKDVATGGLREFSGQVRGVGRFLWRQKREDAMLNALRVQVNRGLSLGPSQVLVSGEDSADGLFELLAEKSGLSVEEVKEAMTREEVREPGAMVRMVKNLQKIKNQIFASLVSAIQQVNDQTVARVKQTVNTSLTMRNWLIGAYIAEYELRGEDRADYGDGLFLVLSKALKLIKVSNCGKRQLYQYLAFYRSYPQIVRTLSAPLSLLSQTFEFANQYLQGDVGEGEACKVRTASALSEDAAEKLLIRLSYSHFEQLVALEDPQKRDFYEVECLRGNWSVRALKRQIILFVSKYELALPNKEKLQQFIDQKRKEVGLTI